jgi:hypothetical protein
LLGIVQELIGNANTTLASISALITIHSCFAPSIVHGSIGSLGTFSPRAHESREIFEEGKFVHRWVRSRFQGLAILNPEKKQIRVT